MLQPFILSELEGYLIFWLFFNYPISLMISRSGLLFDLVSLHLPLCCCSMAYSNQSN